MCLSDQLRWWQWASEDPNNMDVLGIEPRPSACEADVIPLHHAPLLCLTDMGLVADSVLLGGHVATAASRASCVEYHRPHRLVVRTSRCGCHNPRSTPGVDAFSYVR